NSTYDTASLLYRLSLILAQIRGLPDGSRKTIHMLFLLPLQIAQRKRLNSMNAVRPMSCCHTILVQKKLELSLKKANLRKPPLKNIGSNISNTYSHITNCLVQLTHKASFSLHKYA